MANLKTYKMGILRYYNEILKKFKIFSWSLEDQKYLFKVLLEVYKSDGSFSNNEQKDFENLLAGTGLKEDDLNVDFQEALFKLKQDDKKMEIAHFWIAHALFADSDYDDQEQIFIDKIIGKYGLDAAKLQASIKIARDIEIDQAINTWYKDIEHMF